MSFFKSCSITVTTKRSKVYNLKQNLRFWKKGKVLPLLEKVALSAQVPIKIKESTMKDCTIILAKTENSLPVNGRFPEAFKFPMLPLSEIRKERLCRQISTWRHIFENNRICFCTNHVKVCHVSKCFKDF